jgi:dihydrofolate synthase/folylpolyglutamate synthase
MQDLDSFLDSKPLFYDEIDYERFPKIYKKIKHHFKQPKIVHLIGTNGKGTTGRFLASALFKNGYKVGHYTSPHILKFNERIWLDGADVKNDVLGSAHKQLANILQNNDLDALSYFEYTTLLAMFVYDECDFVVLEAGLGGEYDATAVFKKELTLVTPIDLDHQAFLGSDINQIAKTKLNAIQNNAIVASQKHKDVHVVLSQMSTHLNIKKVHSYINEDDNKKITNISKKLSLASYLADNLSLAVAALNFFKIDYKESDFDDSKFFGRLSKVDTNIIVDVGHNPLAATSILKELRGEKYTLIYNSYKDKDYYMILKILKPIIKEVEIINIQDQRIENISSLHNALIDLKIKYANFSDIQINKNYLVFGSFSVVEQFIKEYTK